ncbi:FAD-binding oxidoreductase [Pararhodobacter aggregans]
MDLAETLAAIVGPGHVLGPERLALRDPGWCRGSQGAGLLVRPADAAELAAVLRATPGLAVVPQGGLTGLVEGTESHPGQLIVSFERMNRVHAIDPAQAVALVGAGVTLAALDAALEPFGLMAGVDIGARDSCTIGGMVATNAGGIRVLRYGMMRAGVLGLEVVLADGAILDLTTPLLKNNAGYDLKQVFIGSEGTLGLVTRVALRLFPRPRGIATAMLGLDPAGLSGLMPRLRAALGEQLAALEGIWPACYEYVAGQQGLTRRPMAPQGLYLIVEAFGPDDSAARAALEAALAPVIEDGTLAEAVIAQSDSDRQAIWKIREGGGTIGSAGETVHSYDVSLRLADLDPYVRAVEAAAATALPGVQVLVLGHVGDGNLHLMLMGPPGLPRAPCDAVVYETLGAFGDASVSAEHGIGLEKRAVLARVQPVAVRAAMRALKAAYDPENRLNPGKVLD